MSSFALRLVQPPATEVNPATQSTNEAALESRQSMAIGDKTIGESQRVHSQWYERHQWLWRINESGQFAALSSAAKLVLMQLWLHANDRGISWPAIDRIANKAGVSKRSVIRGIAELITVGAVAKLKVGGGHVSNQYQIVSDWPTPGSNTPGSNTPGSNTPGSNAPTTTPESTTESNPDLRLVKPIFNRQLGLTNQAKKHRVGNYTSDRRAPAGVTQCHSRGDTRAPRTVLKNSLKEQSSSNRLQLADTLAAPWKNDEEEFSSGLFTNIEAVDSLVADAGFRQRDAARLVDRFGAVAVSETLAKAVYKQRVGEIKTSLRGFIFCDLKNDIPQDERVEAERLAKLKRQQNAEKIVAKREQKRASEVAARERQAADLSMAKMIFGAMPTSEIERLRRCVVANQKNDFSRRIFEKKTADDPLMMLKILEVINDN